MLPIYFPWKREHFGLEFILVTKVLSYVKIKQENYYQENQVEETLY